MTHSNSRRAVRAPVAVCLMLVVAVCHLTAAGGSCGSHGSGLETLKQWKVFTFDFPPHAPVHDTSFYNPAGVVVTGVAVSHDRIFLAMPQLFSGVPSTVNWIPRSELDDSPVLQAYPDWSFSTLHRTDFNCSDLVLVSVYRVRMDSCNRLWILDAGISRSLEDYAKTCPPKILIVDSHTHTVVRRIDFPAGVLRGESLFTNLIIDESTSKSGTCDDVFVYITDTVEPAIVVYDSVHDTTWRLSHPAMYPDPDFAQAEILTDRFVLMDGVVGIAFDDKNGIVYFQPYATDRIFSITREVLRAGPVPINRVLPVKLVGKKSSQSIGLAISPIDGSLLFGPSTETAIASWNPATNSQCILAQDRERLQFVSDITTSSHDPGYAYVITSRFHRFFLKNLDTNDFNSRILRVPLPGTAHTPTSTHLTNYAFSPSAVPHQPDVLYQFSSPLPKATSGLSSLPMPAYFSSVSTRTPYPLGRAGLINYSVKNPFTALDHSEWFPPSKEKRNRDQNSFIESLAAALPTHSILPKWRTPSYFSARLNEAGVSQ